MNHVSIIEKSVSFYFFVVYFLPKKKLAILDDTLLFCNYWGVGIDYQEHFGDFETQFFFRIQFTTLQILVFY